MAVLELLVVLTVLNGTGVKVSYYPQFRLLPGSLKPVSDYPGVI